MAPRSQTREDEALDEALAESFPASDPIALSAANRHLHDAPPVSRRPLAAHKPRKSARRRRP
ncbi:MAG TPA: hypothetical protein VKT74_01985 [Gammaproteobacteria bacterium]|nr:hypothetical protein [Gammaproteobacteria bacterium]